MNPLTIWTNQYFDPELMKELVSRILPHRLIVSERTSKSNLVTGERDGLSLQAEVLYGQPHVQDVLESDRCRWVQLTTAGYTRFDRPEVWKIIREKGIIFCNASGLYDEPCAQHVVAMMLSLARAIPEAVKDQQSACWNYLPLRGQSFLLGGQRTLIVGYGAIAQRVVELLAPFKLDIIAFRRQVRGDELCPTKPIGELDNVLPDSEIVINILPASDSTKGFFSTERFSKFRSGAIYINIGRGDTNDQDAIVQAVREGRLSKVFLDVTTPEPLPKSHALWTTPGVYITPHTAGGTVDEPRRMIEHFLQNLKRFEQNQPLSDRLI
jgi:phosphoglycerate dehydrogenase-like enzyme